MSDNDIAENAEPKLLAAYQVISDRRIAYDTMSWQTPALSFTAQAFLFTVALGPDVARVSRVLSAALALAVSVVSIQLLRKHQYMEFMDSLLLEQIEVKLGVASALELGGSPHAGTEKRRKGLKLVDKDGVSRDLGRAGVLESVDSPSLWIAALALFGVVALGIAVTALLIPSALQ